VQDAINTEQLNKPVTVLVNQDFANDARSTAYARGMPSIRIIAESVPCECTIPDLIASRIGTVIDDVVDALTKPLTNEEKSPKPPEPEKISRIVFKGDLEEIQRFYYKKGWTDGLPIIPPTETTIADMLKGTDLPPEHVVGKIIPRMGIATVEKIAINAVMAGALPTSMPVLIAGIEAILDPVARFGTWQVSTGSWAPFWIINGPVRNDLKINSGQGALSPGILANAAIGRALGLTIKNIGGARKGVEDMGIFGHPGKYTMLTAENEEKSPWEPFQVQQGFSKEDNTITVCFTNSNVMANAFGSDDKGIMRGILSMISNGPVTIMIQPQHAQTLAQSGWTKAEIAEYIFKYARVPAYKHREFWGSFTPERTRPPLNADDTVPLLRGPQEAKILVAGGAGGLSINLIMGGRNWVTKKMLLPEKWAELVARFKDMSPAYSKY
jgi:hypothetical protein